MRGGAASLVKHDHRANRAALRRLTFCARPQHRQETANTWKEHALHRDEQRNKSQGQGGAGPAQAQHMRWN